MILHRISIVRGESYPIPALTNTYIDFTKTSFKEKRTKKGTFGIQGIKGNLQQIKK
jgi:hypothetical protein